MRAELRRLDADYSCRMRSPILALAGGAPAAVKLAYQEYASRYPAVTASDFRGINSENLAGVGIQINFLGGQIQTEIKVDQITVQVRNLSSEEHIKFAQDVAIIAHGLGRSLQPDSDAGEATLVVRSWTSVGGRQLVDRLFANSATQKGKFTVDKASAGIAVIYPPHFEIVNAEDGWRVSVQMDYSALSSADLFVLRNYSFSADGKCRTVEDRLSVVDMTATSIATWLGLEA